MGNTILTKKKYNWCSGIRNLNILQIEHQLVNRHGNQAD